MNLNYGRPDYMKMCFDSCLALVFALRKRFEGRRSLEKNLVGFSAIDTDKALRLYDKLWEKRPDKDNRAKAGRMIDFCVKRDFEDKHGHRIAFPTSSTPEQGDAPDAKPVLDEIEIFDKYISPASKIFSRHEQAKRWGTIILLEPQVDAARLTSLVRSGLLDATDIKFLEHLGATSANLNEREMIALGRHETPKNTRISLLWEFSRWKDATRDAFSALSNLMNGNRPIDQIEYLLWQCWSFARECILKAGVLPEDPFWSDRIAYENALENLENPKIQTHNDVITILRQVQSSTEIIWDNPLVSVLEFPAFCCWSFAKYFVGTIFKSHLLSASDYAVKVSSLTESDIEKSFKQIRRCICVSKKDCPRKFTFAWLEGFSGKPEIDIGVKFAPRNIWNGSTSLNEFISTGKIIADWIIDHHIDPDIEELRNQEA